MFHSPTQNEVFLSFWFCGFGFSPPPFLYLVIRHILLALLETNASENRTTTTFQTLVLQRKSIQGFAEVLCMEEIGDHLAACSTLKNTPNFFRLQMCLLSRQDDATSSPTSLHLHCVHAATHLYTSAVTCLPCRSAAAGCPGDRFLASLCLPCVRIPGEGQPEGWCFAKPLWGAGCGVGEWSCCRHIALYCSLRFSAPLNHLMASAIPMGPQDFRKHQ